MIRNIIAIRLTKTDTDAHLIHGHRYLDLTFREALGRKRQRSVWLNARENRFYWQDSGAPVDAFSTLNIREACIRLNIGLQ